MSYLEHFNLEDQPFRLTPDPDYVYWTKQHARAKAYMESTIWLADGFVVITGDIGSGKTTLLQSFLTELENDVVYAVVSQTQLSPTQFLQAVLAEFGFKPFNKRKVELLDMLNMFLIEQYSNGKKVLLIVDEAQNLTTKVLEEIRLLSGVETHKEKVLRIVLAGQPELRETLDSPKLKQLIQRVRLRFHIGPLDRDETGKYVAHRLKVAGSNRDNLFSDGACDLIHRYTGGVPRLINTLCDTALLCAFSEEITEIDSEQIQSAVDELGWDEHETTTGRYRIVKAAQEQGQEVENLSRFDVSENGLQISSFDFPAGRVIVGRAPDNEVFIKSKFVSRHHAQITSSEDGCYIEDLNSTNGVFVNDVRIKKQRLLSGDVISLGIHELVYTDLIGEQTSDGAVELNASNDDEEGVADESQG
jgi:type II secretory pathway predicted ATPase ExeA